MKTTWVDTTLGEIAEIVSGATPKTSVREYWNGGIPWVTPKDLSSLEGSFIDSTARTLTEAGLKSCAASLLPAQSILLSSRAPIGLVAVNGVPMATNQGFKSLVPDGNRVDSKFLYWWLRSHRARLEAMGNGATFKEVSKKVVARVKINVPPIEEQRRIAAVLDAAGALRTKRRQALAKLDDLTHAVFSGMFGDPTVVSGWPRVRLAEVCQSKGEYGANVPAVEFDSNKPRYLRITDIRSGGTLTDKAVGPGGTEGQWSSKILSPGDILFARSGATVGKTFLVRDEGASLVFAGYLIRFVPDQQRILPEYLYRCTRTERYRRWVAAAATTVAQPNVNASKYAQLELLLPPMDLQRQFVDVVERIRHHRVTLEASVLILDALFASLQQRAFRGEL